MRRAFDTFEANEQRARSYVFRQRVERRKLDRGGEVKETESKTHEVSHLCGSYYQKLIEENDKPLSAKERENERRKLEKCTEKLRSETPKQREKRLAQEEKEREDEKRMVAEVLRAYDFTIAGEETVRGRRAWVIAGEPRPNWEPEFRKARFLDKLRGRVWIDQETYGWVRAEAETISEAMFGLFLLKLKEGAEMEFEQRFVNGEVWMIDGFRLRFDAKVALLKGLRREVLMKWSDFRKFSAESRIVAGDPLD